jgi:hypothetical protein
VKAYCNHVLLTELVLVTALSCSLAFAQEETAALNGKITDHDGLAVTGVKCRCLPPEPTFRTWRIQTKQDSTISRLSLQEHITLPTQPKDELSWAVIPAQYCQSARFATDSPLLLGPNLQI